MNQKQVVELIKKYNNNTLSPEEKTRLDIWYMKYASESKSELEERTEDKLVAQLRNELPLKYMQPSRKLWFRRIAAVAAAVAVIVLGVYFFNYNKGIVFDINHLTAHDIAPGKQGATLTLASGKKIKLSNASNGELAKEAGISIVKTANGQLAYEIKGAAGDPDKINTLTTAKGETYILTLPDKTKVWMNAASSLTYATALNERGMRRVKLDGEAYFEVTKDKAHPFIVESRGQSVEVLGTHFNVNAYGDETDTKTTLLEGAVRISGKDGVKILKPGQQAVLSDHIFQVKEVDVDYVVAWKEGVFMFNSDRLENIMTRLSRWYNINVRYEDQSLKDKTFFGTISKFEHISKVLNMLQKTDVADFEINGNTIVISKKE